MKTPADHFAHADAMYLTVLDNPQTQVVAGRRNGAVTADAFWGNR